MSLVFLLPTFRRAGDSFRTLFCWTRAIVRQREERKKSLKGRRHPLEN